MSYIGLTKKEIEKMLGTSVTEEAVEAISKVVVENNKKIRKEMIDKISADIMSASNRIE